MRKMNTPSKFAAAILLAGAVVGGPLLYQVGAADPAAPAPAAPATQPASARPVEQLMADLSVASQELQQAIGGSPQALFDSKQRAELAPKVTPPLKKMLSLINELAQSDPRARAQVGEMKMQFLAILSLMDDAEATNTLAQLAASKDAKEMTAGKSMQLLVRWWKSDSKAAEQSAILDDVQALAKESPENDMLAQVIILMTQQAVANADLKAKAEGILVNDLKGPGAKQLAKQIQDQQKLRAMEGKPLNIEGQKLDGTKFTSADWKGKVVLVDFWATWCGPCLKELPKVKKVYADYHDKGLEIVGISCDQQAEDLTSFLAKNPDMPWPQLFDAKNPGWHPLAKSYGVNGIPTMFLIDRKGILRTVEGREKLEELIPQLIAEKAE